MPKISIVIPVYNAEKFLVETLDSVKNQTFADFECVIVNDGSTDKSLDIINSYIETDNRFRVFTIPNSGCANIPRNIAIKKSVGEYIFNLDADDLIESDCLDIMYKRQIETKADIVLLTLIGCIFNIDGELYRLPLQTFDKKKVLSGQEALLMTIGGWSLTCAGMLTRRNIFNLFQEEGKLMNSDEFFYRKTLYYSNCVTFSDAKYYYRNNQNSISKRVSAKLFERMIVDKELEFFIFEKFNVNSKEAISIRNTRLFNYINLHFDFYMHKNELIKTERSEITKNLLYNFKTLDRYHLNKELPFHLKPFLLSYSIFKYLSIIYVSFKKMRGKSYIYK